MLRWLEPGRQRNRSPDEDDGSGSRNDASCVRALRISVPPWTKTLTVFCPRASVFPAVFRHNMIREGIVGCAGFFHGKGLVQV